MFQILLLFPHYFIEKRIECEVGLLLFCNCKQYWNPCMSSLTVMQQIKHVLVKTINKMLLSRSGAALFSSGMYSINANAHC